MPKGALREPKLNIKQREVYQQWIEYALSRNVVEVINYKPRMVFNPVIVGERVTHNLRPSYPYVQKDGKMPREQNATPIIAWATSKHTIMKIDLTKAFHSVPVAEDQVGNYSFLFEGVFYTYRRMPMGAHCASAHFHKVMLYVLSHPSDMREVRHYQDDIIICGKNRQECLRRYDRVKDLLVQHGFKLNPVKSSTNYPITVRESKRR